MKESVGFHLFWDSYGFSQASGGVNTHVRRLSQELNGLGVHPTLIVADESSPFASTTKEPLVLKASGRLRTSKLVWPTLAAHAAQERFSHQEEKGAVGRAIFHGFANINLPIMGRFPRLVPILTLHDLIPILDWKNTSFPLYSQFRVALPRVLERAAAVICVSPWTRKTLLERFPYVDTKVYLIPNGVDRVDVLADGRVQANPWDRSTKLRILMVARGEKYKRLDLALDVLHRFGDRAELCVVTNQRGREILAAAQKRNNRGVALEIATEVGARELDKLYQRCHVYLQTSLFEGFCLPAIEALTNLRPVVYHSGTGFTDFASAFSSIGIEGNSVDDWVSGVEAAAALANHKDFVQQVQIHLDTLSTWQEAAVALKKLYNNYI